MTSTASRRQRNIMVNTTPIDGAGRPHSLPWLLLNEMDHALVELWRSRIAFIFTFLFPLVWLLVLGMVIGNEVVDAGTGVRVMQFVTPTAAVMGVLYGTYPTVASAVADARERGVLKRLAGTPLPMGVYLAGRVAASVLLAFGALLLMLLVGILAYDVQVVWATVTATIGTTLVAIAAFSALGLAVAALSPSGTAAQAASIGTAVVVAFLSGVMAFGDMPAWADRVASVFPLKPYNDAMTDQFDPYGYGAGWDLPGLALIAAWGLAGGWVAAWRLRAAPVHKIRRWHTTTRILVARHSTTAGHLVSSTRTAPLEAATARRPSWLRLAFAEGAWTLRAAGRDPGWVFFTVLMPVGVYVFSEAVMAGGEAETAGGAWFHVQAAAAMVAWGALVTGFVTLPELVAVDRDRGVLKRVRGTPLSPLCYLAGRLLAAQVVALVTATLIVSIGVRWLELEVRWSGVPIGTALLALGTTALAAGGFLLAALVRTSKAITALGLAISLPLAFFSDVFAFGQTPAWMGRVGSFFPLKHLTNTVAEALDPTGPTVNMVSVLVMVIWTVTAGTLAVRLFRWGPDDE